MRNLCPVCLKRLVLAWAWAHIRDSCVDFVWVGCVVGQMRSHSIDGFFVPLRKFNKCFQISGILVFKFVYFPNQVLFLFLYSFYFFFEFVVFADDPVLQCHPTCDLVFLLLDYLQLFLVFAQIQGAFSEILPQLVLVLINLSHQLSQLSVHVHA